MSNLNDIQDQIADEFALLDGDLEMSNFYLIELGEKLPDMPEAYRVDDNLVKEKDLHAGIFCGWQDQPCKAVCHQYVRWEIPDDHWSENR